MVAFQTHSEKATEEPWLEVHQQPVYSEDGSAFLLLAAVQEGGGQYYTHIKHVDVLRQRMAVLSHGKVEVAEILAWDQENHLVYYLGNTTAYGIKYSLKPYVLKYAFLILRFRQRNVTDT